MKQSLSLLVLLFSTFCFSQVGIGTTAPDNSAALDVVSNTMGFLSPRMTTTQRDAITSPANGLFIFNSTTDCLQIKNSAGWASLMTSSTIPTSFPTIVIGKQQWMRENLDVLTYRNGDIIPQVTDAAAWAALTTGAWCYYNNDPANGAIYGKLYNWYAVNDPRGLAPLGWHVPKDAEWTTLTTKLGGEGVAGGKMKTPGTTRWITPNTGATNESGFTALPEGSRDKDLNFLTIGNYGNWWSSSENSENTILAWTRSCSFVHVNCNRNALHKTTGISVRCVRD